MIRGILSRFLAPTPSDAARTLSRAAHQQHRDRVLSTARKMRAQLGLAPDRRLG